MLMREKINIPKLESVMSPANNPARLEAKARRAKLSSSSASASMESASGTRLAAVVAPNSFIEAAIVQ